LFPEVTESIYQMQHDQELDLGDNDELRDPEFDRGETAGTFFDVLPLIRVLKYSTAIAGGSSSIQHRQHHCIPEPGSPDPETPNNPPPPNPGTTQPAAASSSRFH
jgi:hypothetical protein